jgi:putative tryptophan/tyrosine transport system substrate-binding protein
MDIGGWLRACQVETTQMNRRELICLLLPITAVWPAQAQQGRKVYHIAIVEPVTPVADMTEAAGPLYRGIFEELRHRGYVEGRDLLIERFSGEGQAEHYPGLAREVVRRNPDLIFETGTRLLIDLKAATATIPIVAIGADPVRMGIVPSLARPGGNITGVSVDAGLEIAGKRLELLKEAVPSISKIGFLASRAIWEKTPFGAAMREAAERMNIGFMWPSDGPLVETEYRRAFAALPRDVEALVVSEQNENWVHRRLITELVAEAKLPAIYPGDRFTEVGGLMAYGFDPVDVGRHAADTIDHILRGSKPGEIPIYQPIKFDLSINLKTAKSLGIEMPHSLLVRADQVIE